MKQKTIVNQNAAEDSIDSLMHDLRVPYANIIQFAELIASGDLSKDETIEYSMVIYKEAERALKAIQAHINLLKIECGKMESLVKKPKAISDLVVDIKEIFSKFKYPGSEIFIQSLVERKEVDIEENLLSLALTNLLKNAAEAAYGTSVNVYLYEEVNNFCLAIENRGEVPMVIREHLFEKFATAGKKNGTGLGLFGARLIAQAHGGNLYYEPLSGETKFTIKIPFN